VKVLAWSTLRESAAFAGRSAVVFAVTAFVIFLVRETVSSLLASKGPTFSRESFQLAVVMGALWFCLQLALTLFRTSSSAPAKEILDQMTEVAGSTEKQFAGFVAMEYYFLILNRTFVIFISSEGLHRWKVSGPVSNIDRSFFSPYTRMLDDPSIMHNSEAVHKLAEPPGGFFIPRPSIVSAEFVPRLKWGMGGIPHSGRIYIKLVAGQSREFIVLGSAQGEKIQREILSGA
jgi:hypothetical protein